MNDSLLEDSPGLDVDDSQGAGTRTTGPDEDASNDDESPEIQRAKRPNFAQSRRADAWLIGVKGLTPVLLRKNQLAHIFVTTSTEVR